MLQDIIILIANIWLRRKGVSKRKRLKTIGWIQDNMSIKKFILKILCLSKNYDNEDYPIISKVKAFVDLALDLLGYLFMASLLFWCYLRCTSERNEGDFVEPTRGNYEGGIVVDSVRHYYPIVEGEPVYIVCQIKIKNQKDSILTVMEAIPSDLSVSLTSAMPIVIEKNEAANVSFTFASDKNIGRTEHMIRFYGEDRVLLDSLVFDTHVVRPSLDGSDYEEHYRNEKQSYAEVFVDGTLGQKGYWTDQQSLNDTLPPSQDSILIKGVKPIETYAKNSMWQYIREFFYPILHPKEAFMGVLNGEE